MVSKAQLKAQKKYDKEHTKSLLIKLNLVNDADILAKLRDTENRQGYIKGLIRKDIRGNEDVYSTESIRYLICPIAKKNNLKSVYLFGSYARGEATPESDLDLMIDGGEIQTMTGFLSLSEQFENSLGKKVDVVMAEAARNDISRAGRRFLEHFERDKVLIYEEDE